jgi:multiple sugar transport system ATP-binding protein
MDEPLSNLDAQLRVYMHGELKRLQYELGTTTLYVTHDQAEAMTLAHRVAVMDRGRLQQFDTPLNIYQRLANKFVAGFQGSPSVNFLEGKLDHSERKFVSPQFALALPGETLFVLRGINEVILGVRPEDVKLSATELEGGLAATVYVTKFLSNETFVFLNLPGERVVARTDSAMPLNIESQAWISFDDTKLHFFDPRSGARLP